MLAAAGVDASLRPMSTELQELQELQFAAHGSLRDADGSAHTLVQMCVRAVARAAVGDSHEFALEGRRLVAWLAQVDGQWRACAEACREWLLAAGTLHVACTGCNDETRAVAATQFADAVGEPGQWAHASLLDPMAIVHQRLVYAHALRQLAAAEPAAASGPSQCPKVAEAAGGPTAVRQWREVEASELPAAAREAADRQATAARHSALLALGADHAFLLSLAATSTGLQAADGCESTREGCAGNGDAGNAPNSKRDDTHAKRKREHDGAPPSD